MDDGVHRCLRLYLFSEAQLFFVGGYENDYRPRKGEGLSSKPLVEWVARAVRSQVVRGENDAVRSTLQDCQKGEGSGMLRCRFRSARSATDMLWPLNVDDLLL